MIDRVHRNDQPVATDRRARKRQALRQLISDSATRLFAERGFDAVTVDDIAAAADVSRMTVFNHFPRKEDMFFDRADATVDAFERAVEERSTSESPLAAVARLARTLVKTRDPVVEISPRSVRYNAAIVSSPALLSRAQMLRRDLAVAIAQSFESATARGRGDPDARLAAELVVALWSASYATAQEVMEHGGDQDAASSAFLDMFDRGMTGIVAIFQGTELVRSPR